MVLVGETRLRQNDRQLPMEVLLNYELQTADGYLFVEPHVRVVRRVHDRFGSVLKFTYFLGEPKKIEEHQSRAEGTLPIHILGLMEYMAALPDDWTTLLMAVLTIHNT